MVFVVKHLSFCQCGRVRSSLTMWPKFLSPAFHNLWIFSVVERCPFSSFSNLEKQVAKFHFDQHPPRTPFNIWVTESHVFLIHIHGVYVTSISKMVWGALLKML